ncbi:hypothetical protein V1477_015723 [Vespula maculifrons]|uniref:Uncharacterized protein n=1 Tax=Vespula maculifrons TaxID=7453 RepID=A0ABD2BAZ7_VESMC
MFHVNNTQVLHSQKVGIYLNTSLLLITRSVISTKVMIILNLISNFLYLPKINEQVCYEIGNDTNLFTTALAKVFGKQCYKLIYIND